MTACFDSFKQGIMVVSVSYAAEFRSTCCIWNHIIDYSAHRKPVIALALLTADWGFQALAVSVIQFIVLKQGEEQRPVLLRWNPSRWISWLKPLTTHPPPPNPCSRVSLSERFCACASVHTYMCCMWVICTCLRVSVGSACDITCLRAQFLDTCQRIAHGVVCAHACLHSVCMDL